MSVVSTDQNSELLLHRKTCLDKSELETCLHRKTLTVMALFVLSLHPSTVRLEDFSQHKAFRHKQDTNSCEQHVHNRLVLVLLF